MIEVELHKLEPLHISFKKGVELNGLLQSSKSKR